MSVPAQDLLGQLALLPAALIARSMGPLSDLHKVQGGCCAACGEEMERRYSVRDRATLRVLALRCKRCTDRSRPYAVPAVPPLLAIRLTPVSVRSGLRPYAGSADAAALASQDWLHFGNPAQALLAAQGGGCAGTGHAVDVTAGAMTVDADPETGFVLGLLCMACRCRGGKDSGPLAARWNAYRRQPAGLQFPPTRGLTRTFLTWSAGA